jgi:hypothetical protein
MTAYLRLAIVAVLAIAFLSLGTYAFYQRGHAISGAAEAVQARAESEARRSLERCFGHALLGTRHGQVTTNHIARFRRLHKSDRSELIWLPEHIETFMKVAPIELQRPAILALHTGQRKGDLLKLTWTSAGQGAAACRESAK